MVVVVVVGDGLQDLAAEFGVEGGETDELVVVQAAEVIVGSVAKIGETFPEVVGGHLHVHVDNADGLPGPLAENGAAGGQGGYGVEGEQAFDPAV